MKFNTLLKEKEIMMILPLLSHFINLRLVLLEINKLYSGKFIIIPGGQCKIDTILKAFLNWNIWHQACSNSF